MSIREIQAVLRKVSFPGYTFEVHPDGRGCYMQASFYAPCARKGGLFRQTSRKWRLSKYMTKSEIVQTAFKLVLTAVEHEVREHFCYREKPIFGPHFNVDSLYYMCELNLYDRREEA